MLTDLQTCTCCSSLFFPTTRQQQGPSLLLHQLHIYNVMFVKQNNKPAWTVADPIPRSGCFHMSKDVHVSVHQTVNNITSAHEHQRSMSNALKVLLNNTHTDALANCAGLHALSPLVRHELPKTMASTLANSQRDSAAATRIAAPSDGQQ